MKKPLTAGGYKQTFRGVCQSVRFAPESRHRSESTEFWCRLSRRAGTSSTPGIEPLYAPWQCRGQFSVVQLQISEAEGRNMCSLSWRTLWSEGQLRDAQSGVSSIVSENLSDTPRNSWPLLAIPSPRRPAVQSFQAKTQAAHYPPP